MVEKYFKPSNQNSPSVCSCFFQANTEAQRFHFIFNGAEFRRVHADSKKEA